MSRAPSATAPGSLCSGSTCPLTALPPRPATASMWRSRWKRADVDAFFEVAVANGGAGDGEPGLRPEYDGHYYAAFVRDPDGNKIEALTFAAG